MEQTPRDKSKEEGAPPVIRPTSTDVRVYDCSTQSVEELTQAVLNSGSSTVSGNTLGGTK